MEAQWHKIGRRILLCDNSGGGIRRGRGTDML